MVRSKDYPSSIGFFSPLAGAGTDMGYGYAAVELIKAWQALGIPVWSYDRDAPVIFNMGQPHFYERVEGKLNIGYTPWESSEIPVSWPFYMNKMDEIWTTCSFNKKTFEDGGVTVPVRVLPHGINSDHYPAQRRRNNGLFKFLHIGSDAPRKGAKVVYDAFREEFGSGNKELVSLTLKGRRLDFDIDDTNVKHISEILSIEDMQKLYLSHDAMIYPTSGEGFGLIPFQAAATGMPTAVTNWSGPKDYMRYCFPIDVEKLVDADYEPHTGMWAKPSVESVRYWMREFVRDERRYAYDAYLKALKLHKLESWDSVAKTAIGYMIESLNTVPK